MSDTSDMWREYREEQARQRAQRVPERIATLRRMLPPGFTMEEKNGGYCLIVTGPALRLSYYPVHNRVQIHGQSGWRTMSPERIAALCRKEVGRMNEGR
jgi:hypothetical protein